MDPLSVAPAEVVPAEVVPAESVPSIVVVDDVVFIVAPVEFDPGTQPAASTRARGAGRIMETSW